MIIGVENGSEKYQTKRVNAIQFKSKLSGNISKMWLTYFRWFFFFSSIFWLSVAEIITSLLSFTQKLQLSCYFSCFVNCVNKVGKQRYQIFSGKASVLCLFSCRFWSVATRCFGRSLFSWTKATNFRFRQHYILTYIFFEFEENSYSFWASDYR